MHVHLDCDETIRLRDEHLDRLAANHLNRDEGTGRETSNAGTTPMNQPGLKL